MNAAYPVSFRVRRALLLTAVLQPLMGVAGPVVIEESCRIVSPDPLYEFAGDVAVDGNYIVIGARRAVDPAPQGFNAAFVFERDGKGCGRLVTKLLEEPDVGFEAFSAQVAIEDDVIAVAVFDSTHVFERTASGWTRTAILHPPEHFIDSGEDVKIDSGTILVSAAVLGYGALAYRRDSAGEWRLVNSVSTGAGGPRDQEFIGGDVDSVGSRAIIIASSVPPGEEPEPREAHVFEGPVSGPWTRTKVLTSPAGARTNRIGTVAISEHFALGGRLLFRRPGSPDADWELVQELNPVDRLINGGAGRPELHDDVAYIGFPDDDDRGIDSGSINLFREQTGEPGPFRHVAKLLASGTAGDFGNARIGGSFDISGRTVITSGNGAAYVFELPEDLTQPALIQEDFEDGSADGWTSLDMSAWSVVRAGGSSAYRQTSLLGDARSILEEADWTHQAIEADARALSFSGTDRWFGLFVRYVDARNFYYVTLRNTNTVQLRKLTDGAIERIASAPLTVAVNRPYRVRLEAIGTWLRVYVNGALVSEAQDSSHTHGRAGLTMFKASAQYDNVVVSPNPSLTLVAEDFEDDLAQGWTPTGTSAWSITSNGVRAYRQSSVEGDARSVAGHPPTNDQIIESDAQALTFAGSDRWFGLMTRYTSDSNYYYVTLRSSNVIALRSLDDGVIRVLDTAPLAVSTGRAFRLRFEAVGDHLRVYVNDRAVLEARDARHPDGQAGLVMFKAAAQYDNIRVSQP